MTEALASDVLTDSHRRCRYMFPWTSSGMMLIDETQVLCREGRGDGGWGTGWESRLSGKPPKVRPPTKKDADVTFWSVSGTI